ncbi:MULTISPECIES: MarR family winged helix-turn-helix transcriptional regulator [Pantoea]|jgi:DNA-binding MarR family transcriptional regulator|uniref:MarR family transcriptional regulator n=2 Tax=Pantoea TaxID=53335 RepID=A0ABV2DY90_9GAMM|nr:MULTISPECIES: MarR family transcriptional regulator [Pantoea]MBD9644527.1 MarR family transcriptional regulator [Pantoea sp. PNT02]MBD9659678.1 MarR family transcriptional regulator [Pantoea sp. PNT03]MBY4840420.1 MarR family transcriptional regulator [Pantoea sp. DY-5]MBY4888260.1 MarR family transcriptional regulator [Pantoea sp. DY-15]MBY4952187.1 MarR family transcriptional regulator [Pantoea sp. DY-17]
MKELNDEVCCVGPESEAPVTVDQFLCFALYSASLAMTKLYQSRLKPLGLTYPQYLVLLALWEKDHVTVSELGARVQLDSGTLSQLLKRLEQAGIISRKRDVGGDERRVLISVTEQGQELKIAAAGVPADMVSVMDTPYEELADLTARVTTLRQKLINALP